MKIAAQLPPHPSALTQAAGEFLTVPRKKKRVSECGGLPSPHLPTPRCFPAACPGPVNFNLARETRCVKSRPMAASSRVIDVSSLAGGAEPAEMDAGAPSLSVLHARLASSVETVLPCILRN